ncbi:hypothetical protein H0A36_28290 [Endozoicomonas sp. SM1973]|uniref:Uncharacterized protein n=1 Tax=Spartinivicinus marinus TaxID=2994442 RepID=A0A853IHC9_9GAMM|nr:hypothetical protein [Spartinivicinus marinus]MCX4025653.1 hypothetical protein [Spartinivicinus marinus]NYZ69918.1 hypothetical protein [Spartinivicinus marinus]
MTNLTRAYLHFWDHGKTLPLDLAARLVEDGYDVEALEQKEVNNEKQRRNKKH